jgi:hypothetical protein
MGEALLAVLPGKGRIGSLRVTPSTDFRFFVFHLNNNMDTIFVDQALGAYRDKTGDLRPWESLPVIVTSQILRDAQRLKGLRSESFPQTAAADGCRDS